MFEPVHQIKLYVVGEGPGRTRGRRVVFLASDDDGAAAEVGALAEELGFAPIQLGGLSEVGGEVSDLPLLRTKPC
jgi:predicted dinucleotide-binding enzyme